VKLLAIDRGNSRTKVGVKDQNHDLQLYYFNHTEQKELLNLIQTESCDAAIMSNVAAAHLQEIAVWFNNRKNHIILDSTTNIPLVNKYATPNTLGADRVAGAVGAWVLTDRTNVLLIDAGTCINYELVIDGSYLGGAIAPGLTMRLKAMHHFTGKLPLLELPVDNVLLTGDSTNTCMLSGAVWGVVHEITGVAEAYQLKYPHLKVVLSGGDAAYLGKYVKNSIFAPHKEVVITGLLEILKHHLNA